MKNLPSTMTLTLATVLALTACQSPAGDSASPEAGAENASTPPSASPSVDPGPEFEDGIYAIECDPAAHRRDSALTLLSHEDYSIGGWSDVVAAGPTDHVALPHNSYRISVDNYLPDASCGGAPTWSVVFARKTWDWNKQHANGIEQSFRNENIAFGDVTDITVEMQLDLDRTYLPSADELNSAYEEFLTTEQIAELDSQMVNLEFTLFGEPRNADRPLMGASALIAVDPDEFSDGWIRVKIPREQFEWYTEFNYERTPISDAEYQDLIVRGLRVNGETGSTQVVRHFVEDFDPPARQELFKEMAITFSLIEVGRESHDG